MSDDERSSGEAPTDETARPRRPRLDARGMARPAFLLDFPEDEDLESLIRAFEAGNYAYVREHAEQVAQRTDREDIRDAALELRRRIEPDPLARYLLVASVLLLFFLIVWAYARASHNH